MEHTGFWYIIGSEGYIYAAFKNRSDEDISQDVAIIGLGRALLTSYLRVFFSFRT